jgi:hypothetical protein
MGRAAAFTQGLRAQRCAPGGGVVGAQCRIAQAEAGGFGDARKGRGFGDARKGRGIGDARKGRGIGSPRARFPDRPRSDCPS